MPSPIKLCLILITCIFILVSVPAQSKRRGPKPRATPTPTPLPTVTPTPTPTPTPVATPTPSPFPSPSLFHVDEFGQVKATNYDTWTTTGSYRIGGRVIFRWDETFSNFIGGKVATTLNSGGQQNFMFGNMVVAPLGCCNTGFGWDVGRPTTGNGNTFLGHDAGLGINTGSYNVFIGMHSGPPDQAGSVQLNSSIAIGVGARATTDHQALIGGEIGSVKDVYFGSGVSATSTSAVTLQATGGRGENSNGAALIVASGKSTGNALPQSIFFSTSAPTVSGTDPQPLVKRWEIDGAGDLKSVSGGRVKASLQLANGVKPPCSQSTQGLLWQTFGGVGQGDLLEVCMKTASGLYVYRVLLFPQ